MSSVDIVYLARKLAPAVVALLFVTASLLLFNLERRKKKEVGSKWIPIPPPTEIISLRIYPIKSCRGIEVSSAKLLKTGLDLDRNWMFIDAKDKKFQTIRQVSKMTLINTAVDWDKDELIISVSQDKQEPPTRLAIPAHPSEAWLKANTTLIEGAMVWNDSVDAWMYSPDLTKAFSEFMGKDVRLIYKGPTPRVLSGNGAPTRLGRVEATKFADLAPVQVANIRSLEELNQRLTQQGEDAITVERFRPNIIVAGQDAWSEDVWKTIKISKRETEPSAEKPSQNPVLTLDVVARCARCQVPNVNPDSAEKHKKQPWNTLMSYRRVDAGITFKPCFGMLCCPRDEGLIRVGGKLEVSEVTADHLYVKGM